MRMSRAWHHNERRWLLQGRWATEHRVKLTVSQASIVCLWRRGGNKENALCSHGPEMPEAFPNISFLPYEAYLFLMLIY